MPDTNSTIESLNKELDALVQERDMYLRLSEDYTNNVKLVKNQIAKYNIRFVPHHYSMYVLTNTKHWMVGTIEAYEENIKKLSEQIDALVTRIELLEYRRTRDGG